MKTIAVMIVVSSIAICAINSARADSRMTGKGAWCSSGMSCAQERYLAATAKAAKTKTQKKTQ